MGCLKLKYFCESDLYLGTSLELVHENKNYYPKREVSSKTPQSTLKIVGKNSGQHYRYGFQGQEQDDEVKGEGNSVNYKYRMHDPRIGRFFATDPLEASYPFLTPYQFSSNSTIACGELEGLEGEIRIYGPSNLKKPILLNRNTVKSGAQFSNKYDDEHAWISSRNSWRKAVSYLESEGRLTWIFGESAFKQFDNDIGFNKYTNIGTLNIMNMPSGGVIAYYSPFQTSPTSGPSPSIVESLGLAVESWNAIFLGLGRAGYGTSSYDKSIPRLSESRTTIQTYISMVGGALFNAALGEVAAINYLKSKNVVDFVDDINGFMIAHQVTVSKGTYLDEVAWVGKWDEANPTMVGSLFKTVESRAKAEGASEIIIRGVNVVEEGWTKTSAWYKRYGYTMTKSGNKTFEITKKLE